MIAFQPPWYLAPSLSCPYGIPPPACCSFIPDSQETDPCVRINNTFFCSCCTWGFWKHSAYWWQVLLRSWPCCQKFHNQNKSLPHFQFQIIHWVFKLDIRCQLSASPRSVLEQRSKSKELPSLSRALVNWLIKPSLMCSGAQSILSAHQRVVYNIPCFVMHQFLPHRPALLLSVMLLLLDFLQHWRNFHHYY